MPDDVTRRIFLGTAAGVVLAPVADAGAAALQPPALDRRLLRATVDRIIPAQGTMPAASAIGAVEYAASVARRDRDIRERLEKAVSALGAGFADRPEAAQIAALEQLEQIEPAAFAALRDIVYEAYYTHPRIWALIGYDFRTGPKKTAPLEDFDPALLARVRQLPRLYRDAE
jgi:hypothetical protein